MPNQNEARKVELEPLPEGWVEWLIATGWSSSMKLLALHLKAALTQISELRERVKELEGKLKERTIWANCGGVPSGKICRYDPNDEHEIHGGGLIDPDGSAICELHQLRRAEAENRELRERLERPLPKSVSIHGHSGTMHEVYRISDITEWVAGVFK